MTRYTNVKVNISERQKKKLQHAIKAVCLATSIRLGHEDLQGNDILAVTGSQAKKLVKAHENGKGITIRMSSSELKHNTKIEGGFLGLLAGLAARALPFVAKTVLPALAVGALSGAVSSGVQKAMGSGLYLKKGGCVCQIETDGHGLYTTQKLLRITFSFNDLMLKTNRLKKDFFYKDRLIFGLDDPVANMLIRHVYYA